MRNILDEAKAGESMRFCCFVGTFQSKFFLSPFHHNPSKWPFEIKDEYL